MELRSVFKWLGAGLIFGFASFYGWRAALSFNYTNIEASSSYNSRVMVEKMILERLELYVELYRYQKGTLPASLSELVPEYLPKLPDDVWGRNHLYEVKENRFKIMSLGEDGLPGGKGHDYDFSTSTVVWEDHLK